MRIAIVEDMGWVVESMSRIAKEAGHEVLGVCIEEAPDPCFSKPNDNRVFTRDLDEAARMVREFQPDMVLIDHDLGLGQELTGRYFAEKLALPVSKCVGISSEHDQCYCCGVWYGSKTRIEEDRVKQKFLKLITVV